MFKAHIYGGIALHMAIYMVMLSLIGLRYTTDCEMCASYLCSRYCSSAYEISKIDRLGKSLETAIWCSIVSCTPWEALVH